MFIFPGSRRRLSQSQRYQQELIMQYSSWQLDIALILLLSCGKLVIITCKFMVKSHSSESTLTPTVTGGENLIVACESFDREHVNI